MKTLCLLLFISVALILSSCGAPSSENAEAKNPNSARIADSLAIANRAADSISYLEADSASATDNNGENETTNESSHKSGEKKVPSSSKSSPGNIKKDDGNKGSGDNKGDFNSHKYGDAPKSNNPKEIKKDTDKMPVPTWHNDTVGAMTTAPPPPGTTDTLTVQKATLPVAKTTSKIAKLKKSPPRIAISAPEKVKLDSVFYATVAITKVKDTLVFEADVRLTEQTNEILANQPEPKNTITKGTLKEQTKTVKVSLTDPQDAFIITNRVSADNQTLTDTSALVWIWSVVAKKKGDNKLSFTVESAGENLLPIYKIYDKKVSVKVSVNIPGMVEEEAPKFLKEIIGGVSTAVAGALLLIFRTRITNFSKRFMPSNRRKGRKKAEEDN